MGVMDIKQTSQQWQQLLSQDTSLSDSARQVLMGSEYVSQWGERYADRAQGLIASGDIHISYDEQGYQPRLALMLEAVADETHLQQQLRYFRQREMVRIIWRDLAGWADLAETVRELSAMADASVRESLALLHQWQCRDLR